MLISRPRISNVRSIEKVLLAKTHSEDDVDRFKVLVRMGCIKHLNWRKTYGSQKSKTICQLKQYVLRHDGKIHQYRSQWPIDAYAKLWGPSYKYKVTRGIVEGASTVMGLKVKLQRIGRRKARTARGMQIYRRATTSTNRVESQKSPMVMFVGKPPPSMRRLQEKRPSPDTETVSRNPQTTQINLVAPRSNTSSTLVPTTPFLSPQFRSSWKVMGSPMSTTILGSKHYPSPCAYCGYLPEIPTLARSALCGLFSAVPHVVPIIARSGLFHDRHLEILLHWDREDRREFCDRLPRDSFSGLDIAVVTDLLVNNVTVNPIGIAPEPAARDELENVPWPDAATKSLLMNSPNFLTDLQHAMKLDSNQAFFTRIIDLSDQHGKEFLQNYRPLHRGSFQQLRDSVHLILEKEPLLQLYEDTWPIRFYLQRRARDLEKGVDAMTSSQSSTIPCATVGLTQDVIDPSAAAMHSDCPVHDHSNPSQIQVSQVLRNFFNDRGMQEFVGPLAAMGVATENQFALFRSLSVEQRENLVGRTDHSAKPSLNLFQCMMLKIALCS